MDERHWHGARTAPEHPPQALKAGIIASGVNFSFQPFANGRQTLRDSLALAFNRICGMPPAQARASYTGPVNRFVV